MKAESSYDINVTKTTLAELYQNSTNLDIYGNQIGDLDYSSNNYLTVRVDYDQTESKIIKEKCNIYLTVTPRNSNVTPINSTKKWITNYEVTDNDNEPANPYLIKLSNDDDFLLIWGENIITDITLLIQMLSSVM